VLRRLRRRGARTLAAAAFVPQVADRVP
jgi:hypothetical protein